MPNRHTRNRLEISEAEIIVDWQDSREDDLLDAVASAAALVARADGRSNPTERRRMIDFLAREAGLATITPVDMHEAFESRLRTIDERHGIKRAIEDLERVAGGAPARLVSEAAEQIAEADGHLHPRELHMLRLIRIALAPPTRMEPTEYEEAL